MLLDELLVKAAETACDFDTKFCLASSGELVSGPLAPRVAEHLRLALESDCKLPCYSKAEPHTGTRSYVRVYIETSQIMCHPLAEVMAEKDDELNLTYWENRGKDDARLDKMPLFRRKKGSVYAVGEDVPSERWTEEQESAIGEAYLKGYDT